jgi:hypothetical protein
MLSEFGKLLLSHLKKYLKLGVFMGFMDLNLVRLHVILL